VALTPTAREQLNALAAARNTDGGWGYTPGRASRVEPTCLALLACASGGMPPDPSVLARWPREDGLLIDPQSHTVNASDNGVALLAAQHAGMGGASFVPALASAVAGMKGVKLPPSPTNRQDNTLQGWGWVANTFSWVEPTAWCVLALKTWTRAHRDAAVMARIADGERLLLDRVCRNGGWNYGNSNMLGKELFPYVPATAIALLALQDRRDHDAVKKSVAYLSAHCLDERSGMSLSLSRIALTLYADPPHAVDVKPSLLTEIDTALTHTWRATQYLDNLAATALAVYATLGATEDYAAFRIERPLERHA